MGLACIPGAVHEKQETIYLTLTSPRPPRVPCIDAGMKMRTGDSRSDEEGRRSERRFYRGGDGGDLDVVPQDAVAPAPGAPSVAEGVGGGQADGGGAAGGGYG